MAAGWRRVAGRKCTAWEREEAERAERRRAIEARCAREREQRERYELLLWARGLYLHWTQNAQTQLGG